MHSYELIRASVIAPLARQVVQHYSPNSFHRLSDRHIGPTWIRPQHWGGYIGATDAPPHPHKARQGPINNVFPEFYVIFAGKHSSQWLSR